MSGCASLTQALRFTECATGPVTEMSGDSDGSTAFGSIYYDSNLGNVSDQTDCQEII